MKPLFPLLVLSFFLVAPAASATHLFLFDSLGHMVERYVQFITGGAIVGPPQQDSDGDGIQDTSDNCPLVYNPLQTDTDEDGVGGACDNCPHTFNPDQADSDGDGVGNACGDSGAQQDGDSDGILDSSDNCPHTFNPDQADSDGDGVGNACDACFGINDADGDTYLSCIDDCDDLNPSIRPGAQERCDGTDNNCDGQVDESCAQDEDGDGYTSDEDCDDQDYLTHPRAFDYADGIDNDCDGSIDEDFPSQQEEQQANAERAAANPEEETPSPPQYSAETGEILLPEKTRLEAMVRLDSIKNYLLQARISTQTLEELYPDDTTIHEMNEQLTAAISSINDLLSLLKDSGKIPVDDLKATLENVRETLHALRQSLTL